MNRRRPPAFTLIEMVTSCAILSMILLQPAGLFLPLVALAGLRLVTS